MTVPTVHRNGTSGEALLEQVTTAGTAVREAMNTLAEAAPNARDYYVQSDSDAYQKAAAEHTVRMEHLRIVLTELGIIAGRIADQV